MTTKGGAGEVLSETGDLRGVVGAPEALLFAFAGALAFGAESEAAVVLAVGDVPAPAASDRDGEDVPAIGTDVAGADGFRFDDGEGDFDLLSLDFVRDRFWLSVGPDWWERGDAKSAD